jgi:hypothetical protein
VWPVRSASTSCACSGTWICAASPTTCRTAGSRCAVGISRWRCRSGSAAFARVFAGADGLLFFAGSQPCLGGSLGKSGQYARLGSVTAHAVDLHREAADDPGVRALFDAVADGPGTVFASASVRRDLLWTGRTLVVDRPDPDQQPYLAPLGRWLGLPPRRPHWARFGEPYRRLVPRGWERDWVPSDLIARLDEPDPARRTARRVPRSLRRPLWWPVRSG